MIFTIYPYFDHKAFQLWVFDDERTGLIEEPLIQGIDRMIEELTADIQNADEGFRLTFSDQAFEGHQVRLDWLRLDEANEGNWYWCNELKIEGWLCPALFLYFPQAPEHIYISVGAKETESE